MGIFLLMFAVSFVFVEMQCLNIQNNLTASKAV